MPSKTLNPCITVIPSRKFACKQEHLDTRVYIQKSGIAEGEKDVRLYTLEQSGFTTQSAALHLDQYYQARWKTTCRSRVVCLGWHKHLLYHSPRYAKGKKSRPPALDCCPCRRLR